MSLSQKNGGFEVKERTDFRGLSYKFVFVSSYKVSLLL